MIRHSSSEDARGFGTEAYMQQDPVTDEQTSGPRQRIDEPDWRAEVLKSEQVALAKNTSRSVYLWTWHEDPSLARSWCPGNGWTRTLGPFSSVRSLLNLVERAGLHGSIARLGILAHGGTANSPIPGHVSFYEPLDAGALQNEDSRLYHDLFSLRVYLKRGATIAFYSCIAGAGRQGSALLTGLSRIWAGRKVLGFITYGFLGPRVPAHETAGNVIDTLQSERSVGNLRGYPRLNDRRPSSKVARAGRIIRPPDADRLWQEYQRLNPRSAQRVIREAQAEGIPPLTYYQRRLIRM
jgi:hypothetical protein